MHTHSTQPKATENTRRTSSPINDGEIPVSPKDHLIQNITFLQRTIGNHAVQRLIAAGKLALPTATRPPQYAVQRACGCGCANCSGQHEEGDTLPQQKLVQREEEDEAAPLKDVPQVVAECRTEEEIGYGGSVNVQGITRANYNAGEPMPTPFPDTVTVETFDAGKGRQGFNAHGTFNVTFDAAPEVELPSVPSGLTPCQTEAVQGFIDGPLTQHENDHVQAFRGNYDGEVAIPVNVDRILDTPTNRHNAMQNPLAEEHNRRREAANAASDALDPWTQDIEGLDCEESE